MACALEVSFGSIVLLHKRYVERLLSDLRVFAGNYTYIRMNVDKTW